MKCEKKIKGAIEYDKNTVTYDVGATQRDNETVKCEKKIKVPSNMRNVRLYVILVLSNVTIVPSNVRKKRKPPNLTKV